MGAAEEEAREARRGGDDRPPPEERRLLFRPMVVELPDLGRPWIYSKIFHTELWKREADKSRQK